MNRLKCHLLQLVLNNWFTFSSPGVVSCQGKDTLYCGTNYLLLKIHTIKKETLLLCHCQVHARFWLCKGGEQNNNRMTGESPIATARFYSNGRNSYRSLVSCVCRSSKMTSYSSFSLIFSCSGHRLCFRSLRVLKRSYKLLKPSGTTCSFRRNFR